MDVACEFYFRTWTFKGERIMISRCEVGPTEAAIGFSEVGRALLTNTDPPHEAKGPDKLRTDDPLSPLHRLVPKPPASISLTKAHPPMSPYCTYTYLLCPGPPTVPHHESSCLPIPGCPRLLTETKGAPPPASRRNHNPVSIEMVPSLVPSY
jgi:hypothetical protein